MYFYFRNKISHQTLWAVNVRTNSLKSLSINLAKTIQELNITPKELQIFLTEIMSLRKISHHPFSIQVIFSRNVMKNFSFVGKDVRIRT